MLTRTRLAVVSVLGVVVAAAAVAARPDDPKPRPPRSASPVVHPEGALGFVAADFAKVWDHKAFAAVREAPGSFELAWAVRSLIGFTPQEVAQLTIAWDAPDRPLVVVTTRKPHDAAAVVGGLPRDANSEVKTLAGGVLHAPGAEFPYARRLDDKTLVLATAKADPKALAARRHIDATEAAGGHDIFAMLTPELAAAFGLPADSPLAGFEHAVNLSVDLGPETATARLVAVYPPGVRGKAAALRAKLDDLAGWARAQGAKAAEQAGEASGTPTPLLDWLATTLKAVKVEGDANMVRAAVEVKPEELVGRVLAALPDAALAGRGSSANENNLKQVALAFHNYESAHGHFPGNSYDKDGKPLLSWRVHILPYIEQDALYKQFKLDEPWDSDHNKRLGDVLLKVYQVPGRPADGLNKTYYRAFVGPKDVKPEYRPVMVEGRDKGFKITDVTDGTSNTLLVVEAGEAVPWAKPDDLPYDGVSPLPRLGGPNGTFAVAYCDGSVRTLRRGKVDEKTLRALITVGGGEVVIRP